MNSFVSPKSGDPDDFPASNRPQGVDPKAIQADLSQSGELKAPDTAVSEKDSDMRLWMNGSVRKTVPELAGLLVESEDPVVRRVAAVRLGQAKGPAATEALTNALSDSDGIVRRRAVQALGRLGNKAAPELIRVALDDPEATVRRFAVMTLGRLEGDRTIDALRDAQSDPDESVRRAATTALARTGEM